MKRLVKYSMMVVLLAAGVAAIGGCNTVNGIGKDISAGASQTQEWIGGEPSGSSQSRADSRN